jgi:hypothetical protein
LAFVIPSIRRGAARDDPESGIDVKSDLKIEAAMTTIFRITRSLVVF